MSEQEKPKSFMQKVDEWTDSTIIDPLFSAAVDFDGVDNAHWKQTVEQVKKAIREKVLDSYKNGLKAQGQPKPQRAYKPRGR